MSYSNNLFYGASPEIHKRARELRKIMTPAEKVLWEKLRGKSLHKYKFRRQHPISRFIVDFYCHELRLVVEVDGAIHDSLENQEYDLGRTYELNEFSISVVRIPNKVILENCHDAVQVILNFIESNHLTLPSPQGEG
ncbi:endonuclease domain-containing protein [Algoriphagus sp. SE2]|uniref:endonuclease domain-containing protein n=1 Tax=Algoriphagus sp. SE2 TaxID=3141536 RepID=UPI0031CD9C37